METELEFLDDFDEGSCFDQEACVESIIAQASEGCLYCLLGSLEDDD